MSANFTGVWAANLEKSRLLGAVPMGVTVKIDHREPELHVEMTITKVDGSEERIDYRARSTGEEMTNLMRGIPMRSKSRWIGTELLIESWMEAGGRKNHFCDYWSVSSDGQVMTMEHRGDDLDGQISILEKVAEGGV